MTRLSSAIRIVPAVGAEPLTKPILPKRGEGFLERPVLMLDLIHELRDAVEAAVLGVLFDGAAEGFERYGAQRRAVRRPRLPPLRAGSERPGRAFALLQESLVLFEQLDDRIWIALDLAMLGEFERLAGRPREGEVLARRGLALAEEIGSSYARYMATGLLGRISLALGNLDDAADRFEAALHLSGPHGPAPFQSWWYLGLADVELARGDRAAAAVRARAALTAAETIRNRRDAARAKMMLGLVALASSELEAAIAHLTDALMVQREVEDHNGARRSLNGLRYAFIATGQLERAQRLESALARGDEGLQEAATLALRGRGARRRDPEDGWAGLTGAEAEVAQLAAAGVSNPQIAERLYMSRSTVKTHLSRVYKKLGVGNRTELAAAVAQLRAPIT